VTKAGILFACLLCAFAVGCGGDEDDSSADTAGELELEGTTWEGHRERIAATEGYRNGTATLEVDKQEGLTIEGTMTWSTDEGPITEPLLAAFTPDGDLMAGADEEGVYRFEFADDETLDYCYSESGKDYRTTCGRLEKQ
jgi:hypothetical protein